MTERQYVLEDDPRALDSTDINVEELSACANCAEDLDPFSDIITEYNISSGLNQTMTVRQAVELIFKGQSSAGSGSDLKLCVACGSILSDVLKSYWEFIHCTRVNSHIYNRRYGVNKNEEVKPEINYEIVTLPEEVIKRRDLSSYIRREHDDDQDDVGARTKKGEGDFNRCYAMNNNPEAKREIVTRHSNRYGFKKKHEVKSVANLPKIVAEAPRKQITKSRSRKLDCLSDMESQHDDNTVALNQDGNSTTKVQNQPTSTPPPCPPSVSNVDDETAAPRSDQRTKEREVEDVTMPKLQGLLVTTEFKCDAEKCLADKISFPSLKEWAVHKETEHGYKTGYDLTTTGDLVVMNARPRPCPQCGKTFSCKTALRSRLKGVHLKLREYRICEYCGKALCSKRSLNRHIKSIHNKRNGKSEPPSHTNYICDICGNTYKGKGALTHHLRIHYGTEIRKYKCDLCSAQFHSNVSLTDHKTCVHSEARPFGCDECGQTFKLLRRLKWHQRRHAKNHIFDCVCKLCGKAYAFKDRLKEHLMSVHNLTSGEARISAEMKERRRFRVLLNGEHVYPSTPVKVK